MCIFLFFKKRQFCPKTVIQFWSPNLLVFFKHMETLKEFSCGLELLMSSIFKIETKKCFIVYLLIKTKITMINVYTSHNSNVLLILWNYIWLFWSELILKKKLLVFFFPNYETNEGQNLVSSLAFWSLTHFEFIFVYGVRK